MGLNRALVDRARRVYTREDPDETWREGTPPGEEAFGPWVKVRFRRQSEAERGKAQVDEDGALLIGLVDETGAPTWVAGRFTAWDADDMVELLPAEGGTERVFISSGVRPMRRRKGFVGWRCSIRQSREPEVAEEPLDLAAGINVGAAAPDGVEVEPVEVAAAAQDAAEHPDMREVPPIAPVDPEWAYEGG